MAGVRQRYTQNKINVKRYMLIYLRGRDKQKKKKWRLMEETNKE